MKHTAKWIPVTKKLPKKDGKYLCTSYYSDYIGWAITVLDYDPLAEDANCGMNDIKDVSFHGKGFGELHDCGIEDAEKVAAWMPLPKRYPV